jgi:excisionase family DNA binding protein
VASNALQTSHSPSEDEARLARQSQKVLARHLSAKPGLTKGRETALPIPIPASAARLLMQVLGEIGRGNAVKILPVHAETTTQEAADLLNISRPTLIQMLDSGTLPFRKVGTHRRILMTSLLAHKRKLDAERNAALAELSAYDQYLGMLESQGLLQAVAKLRKTIR